MTDREEKSMGNVRGHSLEQVPRCVQGESETGFTLSWAGARRGDPVVGADAHRAVEQLAQHHHVRVVVQRQRRARREAEHAHLQTPPPPPGRTHHDRPQAICETTTSARRCLPGRRTMIT